jgi:predicted nucleic acid-binding Zn ribbon protein
MDFPRATGQATPMNPVNSNRHCVSKSRIRQNTVIVLTVLIILQIAMWTVLSIFDYAYIFPSRSGLTLGHWLLFALIYFVAMFGGLSFALRRRCWRTASVQVVMPVLFLTWQTWPTPPRHYDAANYQTLIGKTRAEVDEMLGWDAPDGFGNDENGFYMRYNGMRVRYGIVRGTEGDPAKDGRVKAVETD